MSKLLLVFAIFIIVACTQNKNTLPTNEFTADWLQGNWKRINDKGNKKTFENWIKFNKNEYRGLGFTLAGSDTVFKENLRIVRPGNDWTLEVRGVNEEMTPFVFTDFTDSSFTCENMENEFPKKIYYKISKDSLIAIISGDGNNIQFIFSK